jgi:hypothetical protein
MFRGVVSMSKSKKFKFTVHRYYKSINTIFAKDRKEVIKTMNEPAFLFENTEYDLIKTVVKKVKVK